LADEIAEVINEDSPINMKKEGMQENLAFQPIDSNRNKTSMNFTMNEPPMIIEGDGSDGKLN